MIRPVGTPTEPPPLNWFSSLVSVIPSARSASLAGRELSKLAIAWQAAAYGSDPVVFTPELMAAVTESFLEQKVTEGRPSSTDNGLGPCF